MKKISFMEKKRKIAKFFFINLYQVFLLLRKHNIKINFQTFSSITPRCVALEGILVTITTTATGTALQHLLTREGRPFIMHTVLSTVRCKFLPPNDCENNCEFFFREL